MHALLFYLTTLLVYGGVDAIACLGLSQQFGVAGVTNFGFIIFQAAGAYAAGVLSLPSQSANGGFQRYIFGWNLPFPLPWVGAALAGGLLALPFMFLVGRRLRGDFAAIGLLVTAVMVNLLVTNYVPFLNGAAGLSLIPAPLGTIINPQSLSYQLEYGGLAVVIGVLVYLLLRRLTDSPYGRTLRAMRDNDVVADSLGKNLMGLRVHMLVLGGAIAGLSGGILVGFISLWAPSGWMYAETIVLFAAVIIGGAGNHKGAVIGAIIVPLGFEEATRFIPSFGPPGLIPALQWVATGLLIILFLWFRPQGILPERLRAIGSVGVVRRWGRIMPATGLQLAGAGAGGDAAAGAGNGAGGNGAGGSHTANAANGDEVDDDVLAGNAFGLGGPSTGVAEGSATATTSVRRLRTIDAPPGDVLEARGLARVFGGVHAVSDASFVLRRGQLTGLIGPNGAGKSTTLAMMAGTLPASSGSVLLNGNDVSALPAYKRARLGLVRTFQLASEFKRLTVAENLLCAVPGQPGDTFMGALRGRRYWRDAEKDNIVRAEAMIERFGLTRYTNTYAGDLSGGQRRLVEIMRALMTEPEVLLLDEPMAGVHPHLARQIGRELVALCGEGMTIMMVEHELAIMDEFCDPVVVMAEGKVLAEGTMTVLRSRPEVVEAYLVG